MGRNATRPRKHPNATTQPPPSASITELPSDDDEPLMRPSDLASKLNPEARERAKDPLVTLGLEDLKAAGVTFTEVSDVEDDDESDDDADDEADIGGDDEPRDLEMEAWWDEVFDSLMYTVPFSFLYLMLDILTNLSYQRHPDFWYFFKNFAISAPTIGVIVFYTSRHAANEVSRLILTIACILSGTRLMWLVNKSSWMTVIAQAPAVGTLWILSIVQLPLLRALAGLAVVFGWGYYRNLKLVP